MTPSWRIRLAGDDATASRGRGRRRFQQVPLIGAHRPMEPDRRIGGAAAVCAGGHRMAVHLQRRVDHVDVADVRSHQRVHQWVLGQRNRCPPPQSPDEPVTGPLVGDPDVEFVQRHRRRRAYRSGLCKGARIEWHRLSLTVFGAGQVDGERHGRRRQQAPALVRVHPPRGRCPAVEHPCDGVLDDLPRLTAAQELQMHVGRRAIGVDGAASGGEALPDELPSVGTFSVGTAGRSDPRVFAGTLFQRKQPQQRAHATVPDSTSRSISSGLRLSHSASTAPVSSPSAGAGAAGG